MIIKKKYTNIKKDIIEPIVEENVEIKSEVEEINSIESKVEDENEVKEDTSENSQIESFDDLNLNIENIKFDSRPERREGSRRRGFRRTEDRNVVSRAQKDAISIKEAAKDEGYKAGLESAKNDLELIKSNFEEFFNYKEELFNKVSDCISDIAIEIAKKIIKKEIETDRELIISMIKDVTEEINKTENKIILKVMPKDVEIVRDKINEIFSGNYFEAKISVVPENDIKDGGVIVETSNGLIDATIKTQLAIIEKVLKKQEDN